MRVLIACQESQRVCEAFRKKGHQAYSCDILPTSGEYDEWHIQQNVVPLLPGNCTFVTCDGKEHKIQGKWDMIIAFPPCTDLAVSGARWFEKKRQDGRQLSAIVFFCKMLQADCQKICVQNPVGIISGQYITKWFPEVAKEHGLPKKYSQIVQPYYFGDKTRKKTCLWLKGLPKLEPTDIVEPELMTYIDKDGKTKTDSKWHWYTGKGKGIERSKTYPGIANAMAEQWG